MCQETPARTEKIRGGRGVQALLKAAPSIYYALKKFKKKMPESPVTLLPLVFKRPQFATFAEVVT